MASTPAAAARAVPTRMHKKFGKKQVFLPNHVIAFIRPLPKQPPNLASFAVPLKFNKLDLRDYLFHAYNVEVLSVRSFINQSPPQQKYGTHGKWYRPQSKKMMIAELVKPFVWPEVLPESQREGYDYETFKSIQDQRDKHIKRQMDPSDIPLRTMTAQSKDRKDLRQQAQDFLKRGVEWSNGREQQQEAINKFIAAQKEAEKWKEVEGDEGITERPDTAKPEGESKSKE
ncbi:hypothetical protein QBC38DRAFT_443318 [Podospora fimiseda]|uniref:Large ribosomal subunit protein uL23m n=1 Tax=Podospora fimiseda TaxID=252190 RepID=A0AAN7GVF2_9PEZI|nr:hypothetical protein QBC38DRAFT_443318 [Podospora fimiseda]